MEPASVLAPPITEVNEPVYFSYQDEVPADLEVSDDGKLFMRYLRYFSLTSDLTAGYDRFVENIAELIVNTRIPLDQTAEEKGRISSFIGFEIPITETDETTPLMCRQRGLTYSAKEKIKAYKAIPKKTPDGTGYYFVKDTDKDGNVIYHEFIFAELPLMLGSRYCLTVRKKMTPQQRFEIGECPDDPPGYFIIDGSEYLIIMQDKLRTNISTCYFDKKDAYKIKMTCDDHINSTVNVAIYRDKFNIYVIEMSFLKPEKSQVKIAINVFQIFRILAYDHYVAEGTGRKSF
ncbi:MAG TPA: hypothetical protein VKR58_03345, partial [Aquella sp.]|nr:hypothetical protein [Aquella sp.]